MSAPSTEVAPLFSTRLVLVGPWAELFLLQVAPPRSVPALSLVGADSRGTFGPTLCLAATVGREAGLSWPFPTASMSFSLPLTCGWLWLPCVPGWAWGGPPRISASLHPRRRMGPHVCFSGFGSGCCPGWMPSPGSGQCTLPLCSFGCGNGLCIAPNVCSCPNGKQGITCLDPPSACGEYGCDLTCNHGGCQEVARVCPLGFSMVETANGVRCTDINECLSASCEGLCVNTEGGFVCECGPGMQLSSDRHSCQDTDECLATPCQHWCKNSIGSYRCSCRPGYHLHGNRHSCVDVNECRWPSEKRACQHSCHNTPGSFLCTCRPGYRLSGDRVSCEGLPKTILAPSPILQSLQHPPTLLLLPPDSGRHLLAPKGSLPSRTPALAPAPVPSTHTPSPLPPATSSLMWNFLPPSLLQEGPLPSSHPAAVPPPSPDAPPSPCWHQGALWEHDSRWMEPSCLSCTCKGGHVLCEVVTCRISCSHPVPPKNGECCPSCTGCLYNGVTRAEGDVFSLSSGNCTVCVCLAGNVSCISPECPPGSCHSPAQSDCCSCQTAKCKFQGRTYAHGEEFSLDGDDCTTCVCRSGEVECSFTPCPVLECPRQDWLLVPGQCCFSCQEPVPVSGCFVDDNGVEFPIGQIWSPGDPCELCICQADGLVSCKRTECLETCPHPIQIPGQCCPDCSAGCTYMGRVFYNNETFPSVLDPCLSCICLLGSVACSPVDCTVFCTYPFHPEGECCPVCNDCNYEGRKVVNGQTFVPEAEPCIHCTCQFGEVSCEKRPCPISCTESSTTPTDCCLGCQVSQVLLQSSRGPGQLDDVESRLSQAHSPREDSVALPSGSNCSLCPSVHLPASPSRLAQLLAGSNMPTQHAGPTNVAGPHPAGAGALGPLLKRLGGTASPLTGPSSPESHRSAPDLFILKETSGSVTANPTPSQPPAPPSPDPTSDHLPSEGSRSSGPVLQKPSLLPSGGVEEPVDREAGVPPSGESKPGPLTP
ncbi:von Willebrand factor C and EGF domain-containing protein isoform X1 [Alligator mississippiensis]|uniref:von Willebrand factor C and EGF domain-containing protein isoform X1 n=1 Tax=Alligator mississippiensis TaxID=8496 RepID=UPI0009072D86|nr:von Willebrand factor C and EGF domain-containing protein isoform X1 [Alligator mississippiensis]